MNKVVNRALHTETSWTQDGMTFEEIAAQEYTNDCKFSTGTVEGHSVDTVFLRWIKAGDEGGMLLLRPDELAAIAYVAAALLWSLEIARLTDGQE